MEINNIKNEVANKVQEYLKKTYSSNFDCLIKLRYHYNDNARDFTFYAYYCCPNSNNWEYKWLNDWSKYELDDSSEIIILGIYPLFLLKVESNLEDPIRIKGELNNEN